MRSPQAASLTAARTTKARNEQQAQPRAAPMGLSSNDGWSIIERVTPYVHAVGRLADGRGSAILLSLPRRDVDPVAARARQRMRQRARAQREAALRLSRVADEGSTHLSFATTTDAFFFPGSANTQRVQQTRAGDDTTAGREGECRGGGGGGGGEDGKATEMGEEEVKGVIVEDLEADASATSSMAADTRSIGNSALLLTTSAVFASRGDAMNTDVVFLEQPVIGTTVLLGHCPSPLTVHVRGEVGFVSSVAELDDPRRRPRPSQRRGGPEAANPNEAVRKGGNAVAGEGDDTDEEQEVELGYVLTYCDIVPSEAALPSQRGTSLSGLSRTCASCSAHNAREEQRSGQCQRQRSTTTTTDASLHTSSTREAAGLPSRPRASGSVHATASESKIGAKDDLYVVEPLPLPLLPSAVSAVHVGDVHLIVTHVNGRRRHYLRQRVCDVAEDYCQYIVSNGAEQAYDCSGGAVFNADGDFIGVHHQEGDQSVCIRTTSIVRHLFRANQLAMCRFRIAPSPTAAVTTSLSSAAAAAAAAWEIDMPGATTLTGREWNEPLSLNQPYDVMNVGANGRQLIDFNELQSARQRWSHAYSQRRPQQMRPPRCDAVFTEFYTDFTSLLHLLHSFYDCPSLAMRVLNELARPVFKAQLCSLATVPVVGALLALLDANPSEEDVVCTALGMLGQLCLQEPHRAVCASVDGVTTVLETMKEYLHHGRILQWATYCLLQVVQCTEGTTAESALTAAAAASRSLWGGETKQASLRYENVVPSTARRRSYRDAADSSDLLARNGAVEVLVGALRTHGAQRAHLTRWASTLLSRLLTYCPRYVVVAVHVDVVPLLVCLLNNYSEDDAALPGLLELLCVLVTTLHAMKELDAPADETCTWLPCGMPDTLPTSHETSSASPSSWQFVVRMMERTEMQRLAASAPLWEALVVVLGRHSARRYSEESQAVLHYLLSVVRALLLQDVLPKENADSTVRVAEGDTAAVVPLCCAVTPDQRVRLREACLRVSESYPTVDVLVAEANATASLLL